MPEICFVNTPTSVLDNYDPAKTNYHNRIFALRKKAGNQPGWLCKPRFPDTTFGRHLAHGRRVRVGVVYNYQTYELLLKDPRGADGAYPQHTLLWITIQKERLTAQDHYAKSSTFHSHLVNSSFQHLKESLEPIHFQGYHVTLLNELRIHQEKITHDL
jgi:hypothetical protein